MSPMVSSLFVFLPIETVIRVSGESSGDNC